MASDVRIAYAADQQSSVLIVDDELAVGRATERILCRQGYRVTIASGGREAIAKASSPRSPSS